jgi:hypothetical protein
MNKMDGLRGMLLPLPTVFDGEGQVDESVMRDMIQFYVHTGVHGLFPLGSYGMGPALSIEQRKRVAKIIVEEVRGRIPIVLHVGAVDPYTTIELGLHGRSLNVDAIGMVGPYYYSDRTMPELLLHFKMVDKAVQLRRHGQGSAQVCGSHSRFRGFRHRRRTYAGNARRRARNRKSFFNIDAGACGCSRESYR